MIKQLGLLVKQLKRYKWIWLDRIQLRREIVNTIDPIKIIVGAGKTDFDGWVKTDYPVFNATNSWEWFFLIRKGSLISNLLTEHVLEHLSEGEVKSVLSNAYLYLKPGGVFRIAVPDKNHPNQEYIDYVKPNGVGPGASDHKSFWDIESLGRIARHIGFTVYPIEYWDKRKQFHFVNFNINDGPIIRSKAKGYRSEVIDYSSLIVDLIK